MGVLVVREGRLLDGAFYQGFYGIFSEQSVLPIGNFFFPIFLVWIWWPLDQCKSDEKIMGGGV